MAFVGPGNYVVVVLYVGGSRAFYIKLILQCEPRTDKTWFPAGSSLPNEEHVDAAVRELLYETGLTLTPGNFTMLSDNPARVSLLEGKHQLVCVFSAYVLVPYLKANLRTIAKVVEDVTA
jgi:8-oxo-dGTP pyrophosphatase MutT (NUDIX family)